MRNLLSRKLRAPDSGSGGGAGGSAGMLGIGAPPASPAPAPAAGDPPPAPAPAPAASATGWTEGFDADTQALVAAKGWKSPVDALSSYRNLEKMLGGEKIPVPKSAEDKDAWNSLYKVIGRPEAVTGYELDKIPGIDAETAGKFAEIAHANGLSVQAAQALARFDLERTQAARATSEEAFAASAAADVDSLRQSWGQNFDANKEAASRAFKHSGLTQQDVDLLDRTLGVARTMELFSSFGRTMLEARPVGFGGEGGSGVGGFTTREGAMAEISRMKSDPAISKALFNGDQTQTQKLAALQRIAVGGGAA